MALVALPGAPLVPIGAGFAASTLSTPHLASTVTLDAANEAIIYIGNVVTSDGGSHTIDTTGSSSLSWRSVLGTFANVGTTVKVGLAAVDTTTGPPGRAVNVANVITFDVSKTMIGGGGGITAGAWQTHVPDAGSKTIANGDLVAFCVQMTARAGVDQVSATYNSNMAFHRPIVTGYVGAAYTGASSGVPNALITFSDGATGHFYGSDVFDTLNIRTWNSAGATKEYGQLFNLPFPLKIYGAYGWVSPVDLDVVLYSAPLSGSPVAEKTVSIDANTVLVAAGRKFVVLFDAPYSYTAGTDIAVVFKPGATNIAAYYKTLASAAHRISEPFGTSGYGISRASGAFANANSSLDHYLIGLMAGAFNEEGGASILGGSVIS